jgi:SAM-dependent methyltransferase
MTASSWRQRFVRSVYADYNNSPAIRAELGRALQALGSGRGLNVGGGAQRLDPRLIHVDVVRHAACDCQADAAHLPFKTEAFDLVVSQEVVEHVADPFRAAQEMRRVLRAGGTIYLQAPFVIGYHPGPEDYWRFTRAGLVALLTQAGFRDPQVRIAVGPGTGFYRIAVEFLASIPARVAPALYLPAKGTASLLCYPVKWLDGWLAGGAVRDRIPGGYLAVGSKPDDLG